VNDDQIVKNIISNAHKIAERIRNDNYLYDDLLEAIKSDVESLHDKDIQELKAAIKAFEDGPPDNMVPQQMKYCIIGKADAIGMCAGNLFGPIFEDYLGINGIDGQS